ncbi:MAG: hypothetical protein KGI59_02385 [Patescibacteria group bacterium]|nr:hypothetical protein [Patescibacteria group bacterium]MDE2172375.1 hypothetical protein [Patescibacteria group bacterium]
MKVSFLFWIANVLPIVILIAIIEIYNDTNPPGWFWAKQGEWSKTKFVNPFWEQHVNLPVPFLKYLTWYHMVLFLLITLPYLILIQIPITSWLMSYQIFPANVSVGWKVLSGLTLLGAIWFGISGFEDFFYFLIQSTFHWLEPHALRRVLHGDFAWFKDWIPLPFGLKLPGHWVFCPCTAILLLYVRQRWIIG